MSKAILQSNIRYLRTLKGKTQQDIANYMGIPSPSVGEWERGLSVPDDWQLHCLKNYFNISIDTLCRHKFE